MKGPWRGGGGRGLALIGADPTVIDQPGLGALQEENSSMVGTIFFRR